MFKQALLPDTFRALQLASQVPTVQTAYLAGGTALALQLGHRISVDLDFFTQEKFDEDLVLADLQKIGLKKESKAWMTVKGKLGKTDFSLFYYQYPLIESTEKFEGINVLNKPDIAAMKIHALADRGTTRDFMDVYFLAKEYSLEQMFDFYNEKFGDLEEKKYHLLRSLDYFIDAEREQKYPEMLIKVKWEDVVAFFKRESKRLAQIYMDL